MIDVNKPVRPGKSQFSKDFELLSGLKSNTITKDVVSVFGGKKFWRQNLHFTSAMFLLGREQCCVRFIWRPASFYFTNYVNSSQIILRANLSDNDFFFKIKQYL